MANQQNARGTRTETGKRPTHRVFAVREDEGDQRFWSEIGAAWAHPAGTGFGLVLNFLPLQGQKIVLRVNEPKDEQG